MGVSVPVVAALLENPETKTERVTESEVIERARARGVEIEKTSNIKGNLAHRESGHWSTGKFKSGC